MKLSIRSFCLLTIIIFSLLQLHKSVKAVGYDECRRSFQCGNVNISYPFFDVQSGPPAECGFPGFEFSCSNNNAEISVTPTSEKYYLQRMDSNWRNISVTREDAWTSYCFENLSNTTLNWTRFNYQPNVENVTLYYNCSFPPAPQDPLNQFVCGPGNSPGYFMVPNFGGQNYFNISPGFCANSVLVPLDRNIAAGITDPNTLLSAFQNGTFGLEWNAENGLCDDCRLSGGVCGYNTDKEIFTCHCSDNQIHDHKCDDGKSKNGVALAVGLSIGGIVVAALACTFLIVRRRRRSLTQARPKETVPSNPNTENSSSNFFSSQGDTTSSSTTYMLQSTFSHPSSKSNFENSADYFGVKVFPYHELEEATENFHESRELGDGGFGAVYYGKLNDGRVVAVKRLYENSVRHMGQFMNEIRILAHLRHKNLVTLYGCTSKRSRDLLLVYEYIPNGTVADHLHGKFAQSNVLPWSTRLNIAVETAEALSFLHEKEVIHRDVKTTNILLDNSYQVKVADFGLSRLFPPDVTHVSTAPQGTPGYVDPEYYQCYQLTEKSDVYSFGVVLAELISSKAAVDTSRDRLDINLANMVVDRIQKHALDELIDPKLGFEKDFLAGKMMKLVAAVAFQCLQQERDMRPSMKEVLESLTGVQKEMANAQKQVVVDIYENDDVGLLKNMPPLSPEADLSNKSISR